MRAIEISLFLILLLAGIPLVVIMFPLYGPLPTGTAGGEVQNLYNQMNLSQLNATRPTSTNDNVVIAAYDQAKYYFMLLVTSVYWGGILMFSIITTIPAAIEIFHINPVLAGFILIGLICIVIIGWIQFTKGDSFEGKR